MAKSKYAPALFEVISSKDDKSSGKLSLPKWWRNSKTGVPSSAKPLEPPAPEAGASSPAEAHPTAPLSNLEAAAPVSSAPPAAIPQAATPAPVRTPAVPDARRVSSPARGTADAEDEPLPVARVREGRVEFSFNPTWAAVVAGGLLLLVFIAFELGRGFTPSAGPTAENSTPDELESVRNAQPDAKVVNVPSVGSSGTGGRSATGATGSNAGAANKPKPPTASGGQTPPVNNQGSRNPPPVNNPSSAQRIAGMEYVVLESFKADDKAEAEQLQQWLKNQNIGTVLEGGGGNRWQLVGTAGFDRSNPDDAKKAEEYKNAIKNLGRQYKAEFGSKVNYDMRAPFFKKFQGEAAGSSAKSPTGRAAPRN